MEMSHPTTKNERAVLHLTHGAILALVIGAYASFSPRILANVFGNIPESIVRLSNIANFVSNNLFGFALIGLAILCLDGIAFRKLQRMTNKNWASIWFAATTLVLLLPLVFYVYVTSLILRSDF